MSPTAVKKLLDLPADERLALAQVLWESVEPADEARLVSLPEWQQTLLAERLEDLERNPDDEQPWDDVKAELLGGG